MERFLRNRLHICAMAAASLWAWHPLIAGRISPFDFILVPLLVFAIYQWNRLSDLVEDRVNAPRDAERAERSSRAIRRNAIVSGALAIFGSAATGTGAGTLALLLAGTLGLVYSGVSKHGARLKAYAAVKNVLPAVVWSSTVVVYPVLHVGGALTTPVWIAALYTTLIAFRVEVAWDWRDTQGDHRAGIDTLAARLGERRVLWFLQGLGAAAAAVLLVAIWLRVVPPLWTLILTQCAGAALFLGSGLRHRDRHTWAHLLIAVDFVCALVFGGIVRLGAAGIGL